MSGPTDPTEMHFDKGLWGFDGTVWRKLPMLWGYSDRYLLQQQNVSDVAATYTINLPSVPSGEVWHVFGVGFYRDTTAGSFARYQVFDGASAFTIEDVGIAAVGMTYNNSRDMVLKAGDNVRVQYVSSVIGEIVITCAWGYKMLVAE